MNWTTSYLAPLVIGLVACGSSDEEESSVPALVIDETPIAEESPEIEVITAALSHPDRPADDLEVDARRKPAETLTFIGLQPGMTVIDMEAGSGYFTELYSRVVGEEGTVYMQNPQSFDAFIADALVTRFAGGRLSNVVQMRTKFDHLEVPDNSVDVVTWIQGPHELWFELNGENLGDPEKSFSEIARVLKPGGVFVAIDHRAADGAGTEAGGLVHRIEESIVVAYATGAGLVFLSSADFLFNPEDTLTGSVFEPEIRGKTEQFVISFTKPVVE